MSYTVSCCLVGKEKTVLKNISFEDVCNWLVENRNTLFGYIISNFNHFWSAEFFIRYETELPLR